MKQIVLRQGRVIDPANGRDAIGDLVIQGDRIAPAEGSILAVSSGNCRVLDCTGLWVMPGLVDPHVHLRDPGFPEKETVGSGLRAAAAGGFTAVAAMANTLPVNDAPEITRYMLERSNAVRAARLIPVSAVTKGLAGAAIVDLEAMLTAGAQLFSDDGIPIDDASVLRRAFEEIAGAGFAISLHEEDRGITAAGAVNAGAAARQLGLEGIPTTAESARVRRDLTLALRTGASVHIAHVSTAESLEQIRIARRNGVDVTCEATPHHFTLDDRAVLEFGPDARMSPPLRDRTDRDALRAALADGTVDMIATDHAPHDRVSKRMNELEQYFRPIGPGQSLRGQSSRGRSLPRHAAQIFAQAANGIVGLETALGLTMALVHQGVVDAPRMVELLSVNPARLLRLTHAGSLAVGAPADVTVADPEYEWTVDSSRFISLSRNTPFAGMTLMGKALLTIVGGEIVYEARDRGRSDAA